jgi:NADH-quinone oxidoreductase subunit I
MKGLMKGLGTTLSTFSRRPVTIQYPDEKHALPVRARSFPVLTWDFDHDEPFCTGCNICVRNCPVDCMTAVMTDNPHHAEGTSDRRKIVEKFWIDYARCMRCNICVEVCPFEAIVMDNNWSGHEHSTYDRRDLHLDISDLLAASKEGKLASPFRPLDSIELLEKLAAGEEPPPISFKGGRPEDRAAQQQRIAQGLGPAIQLREPEKPKVQAGAAAAAAGGEEVEILSESKIRAKRMRAEREAKAYTDRGEGVPAEITATIEKYLNMKPGEAAPVGAPRGVAVAGGPSGEPLTGTMPDGTMRFPPDVGTGPKGDPNSPDKVRARRMRAERNFKELTASGEPIPEEVAKNLYDLGSDLAPGGSIWATLAGGGGGGGGTAAAAPAAKAEFPPGIGTGPKGDPNSPEKVRARRMRAERQAREALSKDEPIPDEVLATIRELGGTVPEKAG